MKPFFALFIPRFLVFLLPATLAKTTKAVTINTMSAAMDGT
jgi:hypothetical protein